MTRPIAIGAAAATSGEVETGLPTNRQVRAGFDYYLALAPRESLPVDENGTIAPDAAIEWGMTALDNYERSSGSSRGSEFKTMIASARGFQGVDMSQPNVAQYAAALGSISGAASSSYYNVSVTAGVVTVETLRDGKLTEDEAKNMGAVTGAVVGGVVAQSLGVPAPIGAFVGAKVGGGTAAIIANVFIAPSYAERLELAKARISRELQSFRHEALTLCLRFERDFRKEFDEFIRSYAISWTQAEQQIGWRFGLRWFDPNPGLAFHHLWNQSKHGPDNKLATRTDTKFSVIANSCKSKVYASDQGTQRETVCAYKCPFIYGCPYPDLRQGMTGIAVPPYVIDPALEEGYRVVEAFAARGVIWLPARASDGFARPDCEKVLPKASSQAMQPANSQLRDIYRSKIRQRLIDIDSFYNQYVQARTYLQADLTRTIAAVNVEHDIYTRKAWYITEGAKSTAVSRAAEQSKKLSNLVSGAALVGGGALLGYAFWRGLR